MDMAAKCFMCVCVCVCVDVNVEALLVRSPTDISTCDYANVC